MASPTSEGFKSYNEDLVMANEYSTTGTTSCAARVVSFSAEVCRIQFERGTLPPQPQGLLSPTF